VGTLANRRMRNLLLTEPLVSRVTCAELESEIASYEVVYGMDTDAFLKRYEDHNDPLADVGDAEPWFEAHSSLCRLREEGEAPIWCAPTPDKATEGSKEPSVILYGPRKIHRLRRRQDQEAQRNLPFDDVGDQGNRIAAKRRI